ncbi:prepilin peptidase [Agrococcus sediminis]|uniref:Prepilin peptidase n=1 Tax=Agrococcus sediminis TaxID=2599924 RepID=A0A5M8Q7V8_9MICO|nr:prepilin peptidase [Agrococcus sediminis]KAA6432035.1 prepilin peptidase [Agrococcus sediminis]
MSTMTAAAAPPQLRAPLRLRPVDALGLPLAAATAWALAVGGADAAAVVALAAAALVAPALTRTDLAERRLPNALTLPLLAVAVVACAARLAVGDLAPLVGLPCCALLLGMAVAGGMGMGDVKLGGGLALATATLGWAAPLAGLGASVVVGGIAGALALATGRRSVAFGPWLLVGHALVVVAVLLDAL